MRRLLMSTAALVFLTVPALAQPDNNDRGEKAHGTPQAQDREQPGSRQTAPQQQSTPFNRGHNPGSEQHVAPAMQPQAAAPQNVPQDRGDRGRNAGQDQSGDRRAVQQAAPVAQPQTTTQYRSDRGRNAGQDQSGDRRAVQQAAPVAQPQATTQNRGDRGRNDWQGGQDRGNTNFGNRPGGQNFGNRPGGASADRGVRRDFSSFRDYHRTFNAPHRFRAPEYRRPNGWYDHRWSFGEFLPSLFWGSSYWLTDYYRYDLPPPPYGTVWVREGYDALLVDRDSGEIITVEYDVFY
jgi:Ni/Co efflux regulator RcnB